MMRWIHSLVIYLLPLTAFAAKVASDDRFEQAQKHSKSIGQPLRLDDEAYTRLTQAPRDYSVVVTLTAIDQRFGCQLCKDFEPEWNMLGKSWARSNKNAETRVIFGTLDFSDGQDTFKALQLSVAPILLFFHPTTGPHARADGKPVRYDFTTSLRSAEKVHDWISRQLPDDVTKPSFSRPIDWIKVGTITIMVLGAITFLTVAAPYIFPVLQNRNLWAAISLIAVLLFTSGHMFNHIRKTPYVSGDGQGGVNYFASGFTNQYGMESQIVAAIYGVLAFATISLALKVPRIKDERTQQFAVFLWGGVLVCMYSFLLSCFRNKNGGYPFWLPPF